MRAMRISTLLLAASFGLCFACTGAEGAPPDGEDSIGVILIGKADGEQPTECQLGAVVSWVNEGPTADEMREAGVHGWASDNITTTRDGADGAFGTEDDVVFTDVAEIDDIPYVGPVAIEQLVDAVRDRCTAPEPEPVADPYAEALDPTIAHVTFPEGTPAPETYGYPSADGFGLGGTEFWQKWSGGHNPTYSFSAGTDFGRRCMVASALRFEAIMADPPAELVQLRDQTNWTGRFFNWNDDYSMASYDGGSASLWAWRTGLIKWISATNIDGSCELPTTEIVRAAATDCLARAASNGDGEIQGCSAP